MTAWFTPGHGEQLSQRIATAIGSSRRRVRIASPVITSGPILGTLAELADKGGRDIAGVVDGPQTETVFHQWAENGHTAWKIPLLRRRSASCPSPPSPPRPWTPDSEVHDFMHAKVTVADDVVFLGSFNLSRSGEQNAESVLEIHDAALAERLATFVDEVRGRYPAARDPGEQPGHDVLDPVGHLRLSQVLRRVSIPWRQRRTRAIHSISPDQNSEPCRITGWSTALPVWIRVSASKSSSSVPKPPGKTTKASE